MTRASLRRRARPVAASAVHTSVRSGRCARNAIVEPSGDHVNPEERLLRRLDVDEGALLERVEPEAIDPHVSRCHCRFVCGRSSSPPAGTSPSTSAPASTAPSTAGSKYFRPGWRQLRVVLVRLQDLLDRSGGRIAVMIRVLGRSRRALGGSAAGRGASEGSPAPPTRQQHDQGRKRGGPLANGCQNRNHLGFDETIAVNVRFFHNGLIRTAAGVSAPPDRSRPRHRPSHPLQGISTTFQNVMYSRVGHCCAWSVWRLSRATKPPPLWRDL